MELYNYFRSSASWRVRIALALKGLDVDYLPIHLVKKEQSSPDYLAMSDTGLVPLLVLDDGLRLHQSMAIIEYLDETVPEPPLLPRDAPGRARVRALAQDIACEIHPLNNSRVLGYLSDTLGVGDDAKTAWIHRWIGGGMAVVERQLAARPSTFCHGETPGLADCALVPQVFNAQRFACGLDHLPNVMRVHAACMALAAFSSTHPSACPDAMT
jgi:maleylacetoacetate isomerase/maleylpyruvate isomerase